MKRNTTGTQSTGRALLAGNVLSVATIMRRREIKVEREFNISYEIKGVRVVKVVLPEGQEFPNNWERMSAEAQDEWLYERQQSSEIYFEDIHYSKAQSVLPIRHLRIVS